MQKITFVLGGARSGKSSYALALAESYKDVAFIATCQALDEEMKQRVALHKHTRPSHWQTFEEDRDVARVVNGFCDKFDCIVIDCLTLLTSNLMLANCDQALVEKKIEEMMKALRKTRSRSILVANEVGLGIVPDNKLARDFRDVAGRVNQLTAKEADSVVFMVSGLPMKVK